MMHKVTMVLSNNVLKIVKMHKYFRHFFGAGADKAMMIHDKHYKTEKARRQGKNQKNKAKNRT